ncbi:Wzz/FepE/Etk N-terminal domain-containing protein [Cellulosimicrobium arenosum]|uniref:Lipopolysaccharide biosynthesis protein n=1 Tax=Cellulosimicrobium arenosum TaxID=2708133 RepID=A0A927IZZ8_9MICO|nr:Wzz/FepE/Etk N-terminal domain-containing protein [Cellulosimicrobium arenosum]MBD8078968.1 hypothetical protein [Cellulosimicrobium arenosum]
MTLREFIRTVWAAKYYVLAAVLVVLVGAGVYLDRQTTVYEATANVQIVAAESVPGANQEASSVTVDTEPEMVRLPAVVEPATEALDDGTDPRVLAANVEGFYNAEDLTMSVVARGGSRVQAAHRANAVAQAYIAYLPTVLDEQVAALDERRDALREQLDKLQGQLVLDPDDPLAQAERDTIVSQYQAVSAQRSTFDSIVSPAVLVDPATSAVPLGLPAPLVLAIALLAGLVAGVGLAFAKRGLDLRVRTTAEAVRLAATPVLAELFDVRSADKEFRHSGNLPVSSRHASPFTESVRELRTAVRVSLGDVQDAVVVVTAADPHAPRAFITANLAASFALSGRSTLVLCGDLRRPQLADLLPAPESWSGEPGEIRPTRIPNLQLMSIQDEEMDPADFLATTDVRNLVDGLRDKATIVVVDAPPVLAAADATILGGYANGVVLVASLERTDRVVLQEAAERLRINNVPLAGIALAGVKGDRRMHYASSYGADAPLVASAEPAEDETAAGSPPSAEVADGRPSDPVEPGRSTGTVPAAESDDATGKRAADATEKATAPEHETADENPVPAEAIGQGSPERKKDSDAPDPGSRRGARAQARRLEPKWSKVPGSQGGAAPDEPQRTVDDDGIRRRPFRW